MPRISRLLLVAMGLWLLAGCQKSTPPSPPIAPRQPEPLTANGLHNVYRLSDKLYSGSSPEGLAGFKSLESLGIKTIISVDAALPQLSLAKFHDMHYVHLPIHYGGIEQPRAWLIAKAVRDLPGPIYLHCHHGKHRGPTAAAVALLCLNPEYTSEQAEEWLKVAGIDSRYQGLVQLPRTLVRPRPGQLDALPSEFPSMAKVPTFTKRMVNIDHHWDVLKQARSSNWADVNLAAESALQLFEEYREANRLKQTDRDEPQFLEWMQKAEQAAEELERSLRQKPMDSDRVQRLFQENQSLCHRCHTLFRD